MPCPDCGSDATEYVAEVSAEICTACGTLLQSATDDLVDISEAQRFDEGRAFVNNSIFVGEGTKGHSSRFQSSKCHQTIQQLCTSMQQAGLAPRACNMFDSVMKLGELRFGRTSRLVIGAAVALSLREAGGQESLGDIAARLGVKLTPLTKMFVKAKAILNITDLPPNDPILFFPTLLKTISSLTSAAADDTPAPLSPKLKTFLLSVPLIAVSKLAKSLAALPREVSLHQNRAFPQVACALIVMAFEGEVGRAMPCHAELIAHLATRVGVGKKTIEERYRELSRLVSDWCTRLPWVDQSTLGKQGGASGRSSNARYLKDVVTFQAQLRDRAAVDVDPSDSDAGDSDDGYDELSREDDLLCDDFPWPSFDRSETNSTTSSSSRPTKRRRLLSLSSQASVSESVSVEVREYSEEVYRSNAGRPDAYVHRAKRKDAYRREANRRAAASLLSLGLAPSPETDHNNDFRNLALLSDEQVRSRSAIMHNPSSASETDVIVGRVSALCLARGGEEYVDDDELFDVGELEGLLRTEQERGVLEVLWAAQDRMPDETEPTNARLSPTARQAAAE